jgi:branched-chain amino acid transport system permease protein
MFAVSWDTVSGYTGQISFGHGLFFAVGGYTSALLNLGHGVDPLLAIPVGVVLAAVAGILIGVPALRLRGPYLSLVTLVAPLILLQLFVFRSDVFRGELGLRPPENFLGYGVPEAGMVYYIALALFVFILAVALVVTRSDAGKVFTAIREDEDAVASVGINPAKFKIFAFVLSAAIGGLAGAMYVHTPTGGATHTELFSVTVNVEVIIAAVLGGMGTIVGAAIGGIFVGLVPKLLDEVAWEIPVLAAEVSEIDFLIFAVVTLVLLYLLPGGILRAAIHNGRRVRGWRGDDEVATDGGRRERVFARVVRGWRRGDDGGEDDE